MSPDHAVGTRLARVLDLATREGETLFDSHERLFPGGQPVTVDWLAGIAANPERGDLIEAFASRISRFQDGLGAKLLPTLLTALGEAVGPLIDNLNRAHRLGWIDDPHAWMVARDLRNRLVHEYVDDLGDLAKAINEAGRSVAMLHTAYARMADAARSRGLVPG